VSVQVEVSEQNIELLQKRGYEVADKVSIGQAVSVLPPLFPHITDEELLSYGVPVDWLADVKTARAS
jgi:hypothetical protein